MSSFGEKCFEALQAERKSGPISKDRWIKIVDDLAASEGILHKRKAVSPRNGSVRPRNELFDALATATGLNLAQLTRHGAACVSTALADIKEVTPDLTCEEIRRRVARYKQLHPSWTCSALAIDKNWSELGEGDRTRAAKVDVYIEPKSWHLIAVGLFGKDTADKMVADGWFKLAVNYRSDILKAIR
jgi:hypothetical protein